MIILSRIRLVASAVIGGIALMAIPAAAQDHPHATTQQGEVEGRYAGAISEFLGIPYAKPPVGDLRWQPPVAPAAWSDVRQATKFGPACAQVTTLGPFAGPYNANEDCLTLNVFTPSADDDAKRPVIVWIHGGGNMDGSSSGYDGSRLASVGNAVVVTVNYRLGLFGWLAHPALDAEGHPFANYGLLDQQAALHWVKDNIAAFGGDPDNVTLGGQSAGSIDTEAHMASPLADGLFHRAILQSVVLDGIPLSKAEETGMDFAEAAGCGRGDSEEVAACLRKLPAKRVLELSGTESTQGPYIQILIADGQIVPASGLFAAFKSGEFTHMPVMSGTVHDEGNFMVAISAYFSPEPHKPVTADQYQAAIKENYPADIAAKVLAEYPVSDFETAQRAWSAAGTGPLVCSQLALDRVLAPQVPVYAYEFNDTNAPSYFPPEPGFATLAYHTADIQYLFPGWHGGPEGEEHPLDAKQRHLSDALIQAWTNFAGTGDPNGPSAPQWPLFKPQDGKPGQLLSQETPVSTTISGDAFASDHKCEFWSKLDQ